MPTDDLLAMIERFETARDELKETIREAHETVRTMRAVHAELRAEGERVQQALDIGVAIHLDESVTRHLEHLGPMLREHMDRSVENLTDQFRRLEKDLFTGKDGTDIREVAREMARGRGNSIATLMPQVPKPKPPPTRRTGGGGKPKNRQKSPG